VGMHRPWQRRHPDFGGISVRAHCCSPSGNSGSRDVVCRTRYGRRGACRPRGGGGMGAGSRKDAGRWTSHVPSRHHSGRPSQDVDTLRQVRQARLGGRYEAEIPCLQ